MDTLSRHPVGRDDISPNIPPTIFNINVPLQLSNQIINTLQNISQEQIQEQRLLNIIKQIREENKKPQWLSYYSIFNNIISPQNH